MVCLCLLSVCLCICGFSVRAGKRHSVSLQQVLISRQALTGSFRSFPPNPLECTSAWRMDEWHQWKRSAVLRATRSGWVTGCRREKRLSLNLKKTLFPPSLKSFLLFKVQIPPQTLADPLFSLCWRFVSPAKGVCVCLCGGQCRVWGVLNALLSEAECVSQLTGLVLFGAVNPSGRGRGKTGGVKKEREKSEGKRRGTCGCRERDSWEAYRRAWPHLKSKGSLEGHAQLFHKAEMSYWILGPQQNNSYSIQLQEPIIWEV